MTAQRIPFATTEISPEARDAAARVLASGWVTTGPEVAAFEEEFAGAVGAAEAVAVSSCTAAIELSLRSLGLPPGAPVLTSTMTFCGAVHAILHAGLRPVLVDIDEESLMPTPRTVAAAVREAGKPAAMLVVHFAGRPAPVADVAAAAGLPLDLVVEDAAHALWTRVGTRPVGAVSRATCFSFYATKNLPIGEGGMVTTGDAALAEAVRRRRMHGMSRDAWRRYLPGGSWRYEVTEGGLKANMTDLQAAIGRAQLRHLPRWQRRREELADRYRARLHAAPGVTCPRNVCGADGRHAWHLYVIQASERLHGGRDALAEELSRRGVDCSVHFIPLHHHSYFRTGLGIRPDQFPVADRVFERILSLPLHPGLGVQDVDRICDEIVDITRAASPQVVA